MRELALEVVGLHQALRPGLLALLLVLDLDEPVFVDGVREGRDQPLLLGGDLRLGRLRQLELAERLLELAPHARDGAVRLGGDPGPDEVERQADRARLERRQARRGAERLAVELLVDVHDLAAEFRVHRVAAAAEVDEVEEREVLLERLPRNVEAVDELLRVDLGAPVLSAAGEQVGEERLEHREALGCHRPRGALDGGRLGLLRHDLGRRLGRCALVPLGDLPKRTGDLLAELLRLERHRAPVLAEDPRGEERDARVSRHEHAVLDAARAAVRALDPPRGVAAHLHAGLAL